MKLQLLSATILLILLHSSHKLTISAVKPEIPTMAPPTATTTAQTLADLPAIAFSLLDLSNFIIKKLTTLPYDLAIVGLEEYRALVCREVASADSRTPGVFEQAAKEENDFKNAQKVQLELLVDEVKDLINRCTEALQMVINAKPVYFPNIGDKRTIENQQRALLSTITYHQRPAERGRPWHPLHEHNAKQQMEWEKLDLGSRLELLEVDDRLAEADLGTLRYQIEEIEREKEERLNMIKDLKAQWVRKEEETEKKEGEEKGGEEGRVGEAQTSPIRPKEEEEEEEEGVQKD